MEHAPAEPPTVPALPGAAMGAPAVLAIPPPAVPRAYGRRASLRLSPCDVPPPRPRRRVRKTSRTSSTVPVARKARHAAAAPPDAAAAE
ncbi:hypothetical protein STCU_12051 [Strigomonas culicis]|uniref:Uncharacterized protein n=1 Tax=Strigomonas culicis TaxID=28005 RepID=S9UXY7_9TRYP|nr:hypothetical protein STCU_12051 [Strigomonas culicis]|eukprot:EPY15405.1 hypothetical protein STCU_12051 [Strigomonas culicis]